jgi:hypothetical protein
VPIKRCSKYSTIGDEESDGLYDDIMSEFTNEGSKSSEEKMDSDVWLYENLEVFPDFSEDLDGTVDVEIPQDVVDEKGWKSMCLHNL